MSSLNQYDDQLQDPGQYDNPLLQEHESVWGYLRALTVRGKATLVYASVVGVILLCLDWVVGMVFLVALLATAAPLLVWWRRNSHSCPLDLLVRSFGMGFIVMYWSVTLLLCFVVIPVESFLRPLFGPLHFAYLLLLTMSYVGLEEMHKVILARWSKRGLEMARETKTHQIAATATSMGYSLAATVWWMTVLDLILDDVLGVKHDSLGDLGVAFLTLFMTTMFGTPLHVLSGYLVGLEVTRQTAFLKVARVSFLLRTIFIFQIYFWVVLRLPWQAVVVAMVLTNVGICLAMVKHIKRVEQMLPVEYLQRVGYLQAFGYGVLPGDDTDEVEIPRSVNVNRLV